MKTYKKTATICVMIFFVFVAQGQITDAFTAISDKCHDSYFQTDNRFAHGYGTAMDKNPTKAKSMAYYYAIANMTMSLNQHIIVTNKGESASSFGPFTPYFSDSLKTFNNYFLNLYGTAAFGMSTESDYLFFMNQSWVEFVNSHAEIICEDVHQAFEISDGSYIATCLIEIKEYPREWLLLGFGGSINKESIETKSIPENTDYDKEIWRKKFLETFETHSEQPQ